jgi:2-hydroxyglutarate dehydrogenase
MQKLMFKYGAFGVTEMYRSLSIGAQVRQLQRFVPELKVSDVMR